MSNFLPESKKNKKTFCNFCKYQQIIILDKYNFLIKVFSERKKATGCKPIAFNKI